MILNNRSIPILDPEILEFKINKILIQGDYNEQSNKKFNFERIKARAKYR